MQNDPADLWTRTSERHPSFPPPFDEHCRLWRYMSIDRFRWLVGRRRLYMARPDQLLSYDIREGTTPDGETAWWHAQITQADNPEMADQLRMNRDRTRGFVDAYKTSWFISCWHRNQQENYSFWRIYGRSESMCESCGRATVQSNQGVAVTTTFRRLESALPAHVEVGCVRYRDNQTVAKNLLNIYDYIMNKRQYFEYEHEVRTVCSAVDTISTGDPDWPTVAGDHISSNNVDGSYAPPIDLVALIDGVIIHPEASPTLVEQIGDLCKQAGLPSQRLSGLAPPSTAAG